MSGGNTSRSKSSSQTSSEVVSSAISGDVSDSGIAISGSTLSGVEFVQTDHNTVNRAFDAFEKVVASGDGQNQRTISAIKDNTETTVEALKEFATQLTVGDVESAKWIALAIVAAVLIALIVYFWVGR